MNLLLKVLLSHDHAYYFLDKQVIYFAFVGDNLLIRRMYTHIYFVYYQVVVLGI